MHDQLQARERINGSWAWLLVYVAHTIISITHAHSSCIKMAFYLEVSHQMYLESLVTFEAMMKLSGHCTVQY